MAEPRCAVAAGRDDQRRRRPGDEPGGPRRRPDRAEPRRRDLRDLRGLPGADRRRRPDPVGQLGRRQQHPEPRRHRHRHGPVAGIPGTRPAGCKAVHNLLLKGIDRLVVIGGDGSLSGADLLRQEWSSLVAELLATGDDRPGDRRPAPGADDRRTGRLDRQRHDRHRHDDRRRLGAAPDRRGHRRHRQHRGQPSAQLRRRGDGPALRLSRADERHRRRRRLRLHPGEPTRPGLGGPALRAAQDRPGGRPAEQHRDRRRGRARLAERPDHQRLRPAGAGGTARRGHQGDHPRARAAGRRTQRVRPVDELDPRVTPPSRR